MQKKMKKVEILFIYIYEKCLFYHKDFIVKRLS